MQITAPILSIHLGKRNKPIAVVTDATLQQKEPSHAKCIPIGTKPALDAQYSGLIG
jgi:hypothetical protein